MKFIREREKLSFVDFLSTISSFLEFFFLLLASRTHILPRRTKREESSGAQEKRKVFYFNDNDGKYFIRPGACIGASLTSFGLDKSG